MLITKIELLGQLVRRKAPHFRKTSFQDKRKLSHEKRRLPGQHGPASCHSAHFTSAVLLQAAGSCEPSASPRYLEEE
jgi:hypothetical protein